MSYADWKYYSTKWSGKIPQEKYNFLANKATQHMDYLSFGRANSYIAGKQIKINNRHIDLENMEDITDNIRLCQCEIADYLYELDVQAQSQTIEDGKGVVKSVAVEGYKIEYSKPSLSLQYKGSDTLNGVNGVIYEICQKYLIRPINLMYVGVE